MNVLHAPPGPDPDSILANRNGRRVIEVKRWNPLAGRFDVLWYELMGPCVLEDGTKATRDPAGYWVVGALQVRTRRRPIYNPAGTQ